MTATVVSLAAPEHIMQVDAAYRDGGNCRWIMSDTSLVKVWQSQTTANQPLFQPGAVDITGKPGLTLYGYPITNDAAAGNLVAFGDFRRGYIIRRVRGVQVLVDPYTAQSTRQIAYHAWARMDANIQDSYAYSVSTWASVNADS
jgi:HK97 family phage major capsid protein